LIFASRDAKSLALATGSEAIKTVAIVWGVFVPIFWVISKAFPRKPF